MEKKYRLERIKGILFLIHEFPIDIIASKIDALYYDMVDCPECAGKGKILADIPEDEDCEECLGTGKVEASLT